MLPDKPPEMLIRQNPHPYFDMISKYGYTFHYCWRNEESHGFVDLKIVVMLEECMVAEAEFWDDGPNAHCQNIEVNEAHQRRKLATAIYMLAERIYGKHLCDYWKNGPNRAISQSNSAKKLWEQQNRPFGVLRNVN